MAKSRKNNKYKTKKRRDKGRNKKTKRLKNRKSKATNKYASQKGGALPVVAAAAIGTAVGAGATAYASSRRVKGDLGKIIQKFHLYKKKYFRLNSLRECILYVVNHGGKYRFYFDNKNKEIKKNIGQQLTEDDVGGSSPPEGNIFKWSFHSEQLQGLEDKYVPTVIKLSPPRDKVKVSRLMRIPEYTGFDNGNYEVPIIFGINTHTAYSDNSSEFTVINNELLDYLNKGITDENCDEPEPESMGVESGSMGVEPESMDVEPESMGVESEGMGVEPKTTMERARAGTGISLDNELIQNRELIYSKIKKKEEGNVRLGELIDKIIKKEATEYEIAEKDKLNADLKKMNAEIRELKDTLKWKN